MRNAVGASGSTFRMKARRPKRLRRILLAAGFAVFGLATSLLLVLALFLDPWVERTIEDEGSQALGTSLLLDAARLRLRGGVQLDRLAVLNPDSGPTQGDLGEAFRVDRIVARSRLRAVLADPVEVAELEVVQPEFTFVFADGRSNWGELMQALARRVPSAGDPERSPAPRRFLIRKTRIRRPILHLHAPALGEGLTLRLRDIELDRIGNLPDSPTPLYLVLAALLQALVTGGLDDEGMPRALRSSLGAELEEALKAFGGLLREPG